MAAALKECCVSMATDDVILLCYVLLTLVFKFVKERLEALAAAAWDFIAAATSGSRGLGRIAAAAAAACAGVLRALVGLLA